MKKFAIGISVYNSFQNLIEIFTSIKVVFSKKDYILEVILIDNASILGTKEKKKIVLDLKKKFNLNIILILNKKNFELGGSQKIILNYIKKNSFDYYINLHSSGRYSSFKVLSDIMNSQNYKKADYLIFSRFLKKKDTINYSLRRFYGNLFFIKLTHYVSKCKFTDPGCAIYCINTKLLKKIDFYSLTNSSQFNHLMNILLCNVNVSAKELRIKWGEGNVKSHLSEIQYGLELLHILIKYFFTRKFNFNLKINEDNIDEVFKFDLIKY